MTISPENFVASLQKLVPRFRLNPVWIEEGPRYLDFPIINDLGRYICEQMNLQDLAEVDKGILFLELCLEGGDLLLRDLVIECLETLVECRSIAMIKERFAPAVRKMWDIRFQQRFERRRTRK